MLRQAWLCPLQCCCDPSHLNRQRRRHTGCFLEPWRPTTCWLIDLGREFFLGLKHVAMGAGSAGRVGIFRLAQTALLQQQRHRRRRSPSTGAGACGPHPETPKSLAGIGFSPKCPYVPLQPQETRKKRAIQSPLGGQTPRQMRCCGDCCLRTQRRCHRDGRRPEEQCIAPAGPACSRARLQQGPRARSGSVPREPSGSTLERTT